jgi:N-methylhydantoinase B
MSVDAISLGVFQQLFASVAEEMGLTLQRASFSPNIRERLDFSCAVFDAQARLVAQAAHIPVHLGSMPASVLAAVQAFPSFSPGDVVVLNDPYRGGTHLPDITMVSPVFAGGDLLFFVASRAHHADVGGMSPGSLPLSTELYQEGIIIPPVLLKLSGWMNEGVLALLLANSRNPHERQGDLEAQLAAQRIGEARLFDLLITQGTPRVIEHMEALIDYAERMTRAVIAAIPDGLYVFEDALESSGQNEDSIPIRAALNVQGDSLHIDFAGTSPQVTGNVNAVSAIVQSAVGYCVRLLADDELPMNHGSFLPISINIPPHSLLSPDFPAAVAVGNTETGQRIVDVVLGALAQALPDRIPAASQGTMNNITVGGFVRGQAFVYYETIGGGHGASPTGNGLSGRHSHMTNTRNTPIEALEMSLPLRVWRYHLRENSGGAGHYKGGEGLVREYEFLVPATVTLNTERRRLAPYGVQGGSAGAVGRNTHIRGTQEMILTSKCTLTVQAGDRVRIETPGGGGWGSET